MDWFTVRRGFVLALAVAMPLPYLVVAWRWIQHPTASPWAEPFSHFSDPEGSLVIVIAGSVLVLLAECALVIAIAARGFGNPQGRFLAYALALKAATIGVLGLSYFVEDGGTADDFLSWASMLALAFAIAYLYRFLRSYPEKVSVESFETAEERGGILGLVRVLARRALDNNIILYTLLVSTAAIAAHYDRTPHSAGATLPFLIVMSFVFVAALQATFYNGRHAVAKEGGRHEWVYFGIWGAALLWIATWAAGLFAGIVAAATRTKGGAWNIPPALGYFIASSDAVFWLLVLGLLAISIFYHGTLDPRITVRRASVAAFIATAVALLFVIVERMGAQYVARSLGLPDDWAWVVAAVVAGGVGLPLRKLADSGIRRLFERLSPPTELANGEHRHAVIVFSDLSGFTALSGRDERSAVIAASLLHKTAREAARANGGRLVKTVGDAVVLEFAQADQALAAVSTIHRQYAQGSAVLGLPALAVHTGLNAGDILVASDGDIYGSTVNLAARLQDAARPGEIVASEEVKSASPATNWFDLGERAFKNVERPVRCWRLLDVSEGQRAATPAVASAGLVPAQ